MVFLYNGNKIFYSDEGNGAPIVLLHGYLESSEVWNGFREKLAVRFRVISMDLPGHGQSGIYGDTHSMEFMAGVVKALIDHLKIKRMFLTGHSLGGYVALAFLELFPGYLYGYSLFHSQPLADPPEAIEKRLREISIVRAGKKELIYPDNVTRMFAPSNLKRFSKALLRSKEIASQIPGEGIIAVLNGMIMRPSRVSLMEKGIAPCLWILGLMDNYIPCGIIQQQVSLPSDASVEVLNKSGHMGFIEEEDRAVMIVSKFVEKVAG